MLAVKVKREKINSLRDAINILCPSINARVAVLKRANRLKLMSVPSNLKWYTVGKLKSEVSIPKPDTLKGREPWKWGLRREQGTCVS